MTTYATFPWRSISAQSLRMHATRARGSALPFDENKGHAKYMVQYQMGAFGGSNPSQVHQYYLESWLKDSRSRLRTKNFCMFEHK